MADTRPIIVIKKKKGHGGHHGGAWKVAYADFVTAMMALFIVLWLTSSGEKVRKSIAGYFNDPSGTSKNVGTDRAGSTDALSLDKANIKELKERLQQGISQKPELKELKDQIEIIITPEGMRIELMEAKDGTFFESGSAVLKPIGRELLELLAKELNGVPNRVSIEGHTDAQKYADDAKYDNWELSTDRANAARRLMQTAGMRTGQLSQVRGFADQQLRVASNPMDPSNRRISVIVHFLELDKSAPPLPKIVEGIPPKPDSASTEAKDSAKLISAPTQNASGTGMKEAGAKQAAEQKPEVGSVGRVVPVAGSKKGLQRFMPSVHPSVAILSRWGGSILHRHSAQQTATPAGK